MNIRFGLWTLGHVVPVHARQVFEQYGQGLGTVTMEGHEAKHIFLKRLSENTTYQRRWVEILKHEFIMMVWLPEQGFTVSENKVQMQPTSHRGFSVTQPTVTVGC